MQQIQNAEAEKHLLGCILLDPDIAKELIIEPNQVSVLHTHIFKAIKDLTAAGQKVSLATLASELTPNVFTQTDWKAIKESVPSTHAHLSYQQLILDAHKHSMARIAAQNFIDSTYDHVTKSDFQEFVEQVAGLNLDGYVSRDFDIKQMMVEIFDEAESGYTEQGMLTGFNDYDRMTNGHKKGELTIVAARPSVGKTAFAINMSNSHMDNGAYGHLYSLEMRDKKFVKRMLTANGRIDGMKMRDPKRFFDGDDWNKFAHSMNILSKQDMYIHDSANVKVAEIYSNTKRLMRKYPDHEHFVMIDYLQLLTPANSKVNRNEQIAEISRALKNMAMDLNIPVIALSQLSRGVESRQDKRPMLSDLRDSGSIEQDADNVIFLYRDDYYDRESERKDIIEIIIAKQREGPVGTVELAFMKEYNLFVNLDRRHIS